MARREASNHRGNQREARSWAHPLDCLLCNGLFHLQIRHF